jgi:hypothetical protein
MIDPRFKPLTRWIGTKTSGRTHGPFRAGYDDTLDLLDKNLFHLTARNGVVEAAFRPDQIRNDGWPSTSTLPCGLEPSSSEVTSPCTSGSMPCTCW